MRFHILAFFLGFLMDLLIGDPQGFPHPVRLIGALIAKTQERLGGTDPEKSPKEQLRLGKYLVGIVLSVTFLTAFAALFAAYWLHPAAGLIVEAVMTWQILAVKCLKVESMKVYRFLKNGNLEEARTAVSMIVGRDTAVLDAEGVAKAAVETVAENTSDGVIAPMLYTAFGGPVLGFLYKAVNTMDSMVGYRNDRYLYLGRAAAKLDDLVNFIPARISAVFMIAAAFLLRMDGKGAARIFRRDRFRHASPNSAQTEAVCAGALSVRLAGDAWYFGVRHEKPYIGDAVREIEVEDICRANLLMVVTALLVLLSGILIVSGILILSGGLAAG